MCFNSAKCIVFQRDEALRALLVNERLQRLSMKVLDDQVSIEELLVEDLCQNDTKRRLPRTRHSNQHDVAATLTHGRLLALHPNQARAAQDALPLALRRLMASNLQEALSRQQQPAKRML